MATLTQDNDVDLSNASASLDQGVEVPGLETGTELDADELLRQAVREHGAEDPTVVEQRQERATELVEHICEKCNTGIFGTGNDEAAVIEALKELSADPQLHEAADEAMLEKEGVTVSEYIQGQLKDNDLDEAMILLHGVNADTVANSIADSFRESRSDVGNSFELEFSNDGQDRLKQNLTVVEHNPQIRAAVLERFREVHGMELEEALAEVRGIDDKEYDRLVEQAYGFDAERTARTVYENAGSDQDRTVLLLMDREDQQIKATSDAFETLPENTAGERMIDYTDRVMDGDERDLVRGEIERGALEIEAEMTSQEALVSQDMDDPMPEPEPETTVQKLSDPEPDTEVELPEFDHHVYKLKQGESLSVVERKFGIGNGDGELLMMLNGIEDPTRMQIGAEVKIPVTYEVSETDNNLTQIADDLNERYGRTDLTAEKIFEYNHTLEEAADIQTAVGSNVNQVYREQLIYVPPIDAARQLGEITETRDSRPEPEAQTRTDAPDPLADRFGDLFGDRPSLFDRYAEQPPEFASAPAESTNQTPPELARQMERLEVTGFIVRENSLQDSILGQFENQRRQGETVDKFILRTVEGVEQQDRALEATGYNPEQVRQQQARMEQLREEARARHQERIDSHMPKD